jgi:hypothetical protein
MSGRCCFYGRRYSKSIPVGKKERFLLIPSEVARPRRARSDLVFMVGSEIPSSSDLATVSILIGAFELFWW